MEGLLEIICDLIRINKDRGDYYERLIIETEIINMELIEILKSKANDNYKNAEKLSGLIVSNAGYFCEYTVTPGKIFRVWKDAKNGGDGKDREGLLNSCECGDAATLEAYKTALNSDSLNDYASRELIMDQKYSLQTSHDSIKKYRDFQVLVHLQELVY